MDPPDDSSPRKETIGASRCHTGVDGAKNVPLGPSRFLGTRILLCLLGAAILAPGCSDAPPGSADALPAPQESSACYSGPVSEERVQELMIANSDHGEAIEVTRSGDIVWRFRNPHVNSEGYRSTIVRIKRYPIDWIQPLLKKP